MPTVTRRLHLLLAMPPSFWAAFFAVFIASCASKPPDVPYTAFVQSDELPDVFLASLPGVRAKQYAGDPQTRRTSNRVDFPAGWSGTTGGAPGKLLEIVVLNGELTVGDLKLGPGGYAHIPPGSLGFNITTGDGARVLYFLDNVDPLAMIRAPLLLDSQIIDWEATDTDGITIKTLRSDPGNGARTWFMRVSPGASMSWQTTTVIREGYLVSGQYQDSECVAGEAMTWTYMPGGYVYRPAGAVHGGPDSMAITESVWLFRERSAGSESIYETCR